MTSSYADLAGRVAIVTGASRGIGKGIATELVRQGCRVMFTSKNEARLKEAVEEVTLAEPTAVVSYAVTHAADPDGAAACAAKARTELGPVSILVNNAGTNPYYGPVKDIPGDQAQRTTLINQYAPILWTRSAWDAGLSAGGAIVNISSIGGLQAEPGLGYYDGSKAALIHLTRQLGAELAPTVRVNCIAPGLVKTDLARVLWEGNEAELASRIPLARLGAPADIGQVAAFLVSEASSWVTGQTLAVDGGALVAAALTHMPAEAAHATA